MGGDLEEMERLVEQNIGAEEKTLGQKTREELLDNATAEVVDGVVETVEFFALETANKQFYADEQKESRNCKRDIIHQKTPRQLLNRCSLYIKQANQHGKKSRHRPESLSGWLTLGLLCQTFLLVFSELAGVI